MERRGCGEWRGRARGCKDTRQGGLETAHTLAPPSPTFLCFPSPCLRPRPLPFLHVLFLPCTIFLSPFSLKLKCAVRAETEVRAERGGDDSDDEVGGRGKKGRGGKGGGKGREVEADEDDDDGKKKKGGKREQQKEEVRSPWCLVFISGNRWGRGVDDCCVSPAASPAVKAPSDWT